MPNHLGQLVIMRAFTWTMTAAVLGAAIGGCSAKKEEPEVAAGTGASAMAAGSGGMSAAGDMSAAGTGAPSGGTGGDQSSGMAGTGAGMMANAGTTGGSSSGSGGMDTTPPPIEELPPCDSWDQLALLFSASPNCMSSTNMTETAIGDCSKGYSAFDGEHTFQIPAQVDGATVELADWHAVPEGAAIFEEDPETGGVMITVQQGVPEITIGVCTGGGTVGGTAPLYITQGTPEEWAIGEARYHNMVVYEWPPISFMSLLDPNYVPPEPPDDLACDNCHGSGAPALAIEHTPTQIGYVSDENLTAIFETGMKPPGVAWSLVPPGFQQLYPKFHTWVAGDDAQKALIVYLRSFTPVVQGEIVPPPLMP